MSFAIVAKVLFNAGQAEARIKSLGKSFRTLKRGASNVGAGFRDASQGIRGLALATAPAGLLFGSAVMEAAKFDKAMSATQSVLVATKKEMTALTAQAKLLGRTTKFTAIEAAQGQKKFAQAGFTQLQILNALPAALNAATAGEIAVADAANLMVGTIAAFSLEASEAERVADGLAFVTASTNVDMIEFGESMKLLSSTAARAGFSFEETAVAVGIMGNANIKGTLSATALRAALNKLGKPSKKAIELFGGDKGFKRAFTKADGSLRPLNELFANTAQMISKIENEKDKLAALGAAAELFGIRGSNALGAFSTQMTVTTRVTDKNINIFRAAFKKSGGELSEFTLQVGDTVPKVVALNAAITAAGGITKTMAAIRLDNLLGDVKLLTSAASGLQIEIGSLTFQFLRPLTTKLTDKINILSDAFSFVSGNTLAFGDIFEATADKLQSKIDTRQLGIFGERLDNISEKMSSLEHGKTLIPFKEMEMFNKEARKAEVTPIIAFVRGLKAGFFEAVELIKEASRTLEGFYTRLTGNTKLSSEELGRLIGKYTTLAAVASPVLAGLAAAAFVLSPLFVAVGGSIRLVFGVLQLLWGTIGFIISGVLALGSKIAALVTSVKVFAAALGISVKAFLAPFAILAFKILIIAAIIIGLGILIWKFRNEIAAAFTSIWNFIKPIVFAIWTAWKVIFDNIVEAAGPAFEGVMKPLREIGDLILSVLEPLWNVIKIIFNTIVEGFHALFGGPEQSVKNFQSAVIFVVQLIGNLISNFITIAIQAFGKLFKLIALGLKFVITLWVNLFKIILGIAEPVFVALKNIITGFFGFLFEAFEVFTAAKNEGGIWEGLVTGLEFAASRIEQGMTDLIANLVLMFVRAFENIWGEFQNIGKRTISSVTDIFNALNPFSSDDKDNFIPIPKSGPTITTGDLNDGLETAGATKEAIKANNAARTRDSIVTTFAAKSADKKIGVLEEQLENFTVHSTLFLDGDVAATSIEKIQRRRTERGKNQSDKRGLVNKPATGT